MAITFKSVLASGGSGAVITVTYSAEFYNQTLTATNGTDTVTALATSAGTVDITVPSAGSWVVSCTISGETYTSDTVSVDLSYSTELVAIPDGSTVTPTDDVQTWLKCAGIKDKNYTTLSQVLADSVTFNALLGDSNACAYMARSTTWASGLVPTMTSNTTPSGVASASTAYPGSYAYMAFDKTTSTAWSTDNSITNAWVQYQFTSSVELASFKAVYANGRMGHYKIQGSNDGFVSDVHDLYVGQETSSGSGLATISHSFSDTAPYTYYRLHILDTVDGNGIYFNELQFYANSDGIGLTESQYAMSMIGQYDVCCDALLGNATWASAIVASAYADYVLTYEHGLVPVLTSDTGLNGESIGSRYLNDSYHYYNAFNPDILRGWLANQGGTYIAVNDYVGYRFNTPAKSALVSFVYKYYQGTNSISGKIQGYNGTSWIDLTDEFTYTTSSNNTPMYRVLTNVDEYEQYRWICTTAPSNDYTYGIKLQFYGMGEATNTEYIHGTTNESAYYLDNGTEVAIVDPSTLSAGTYTFGSTVAKDPSDLTADYTKSIRITPNTVEVVLRPDCALYWWGYVGSNLEVVNTANGWSRSGMSLNSPTFNVNNILCTSSGSSDSQNVGLKTSAYGINNLYVIATGVTASNGNYGYMILNNTKTWSPTSSIKSEYINVITQTKYTFSCEQATANSYLFVGAGWSMACTLHAIWTD